jgi:pyridoxamine 5'-phosphate oxidase
LANKFKFNRNIKFGGEEPITLFAQWLKQAEELELDNPNACALATADKHGRPSVRMVLLKGFDEKGFVFYTNSESQKGRELTENPYASLCFYWKSLGREIRINGPVEEVTIEQANEYFDSRARESQIGAWASKQSRLLRSQDELEEQIAIFTARFDSKKVPRPEFWRGYRIKPEVVEFWIEKNFRLHERFVYKRIDQGWKTERLYP